MTQKETCNCNNVESTDVATWSGAYHHIICGKPLTFPSEDAVKQANKFPALDDSLVKRLPDYARKSKITPK